jgi:hypothetical protein
MAQSAARVPQSKAIENNPRRALEIRFKSKDASLVMAIKDLSKRQSTGRKIRMIKWS